MAVKRVLNLLEQLSGPDIREQFQQECFEPEETAAAFIVGLNEDDPENDNDVALDIISRNPLYAELNDTDELIMNVRQIANYAFLKDEFAEALDLFNIAIEFSRKRLPILFNSRALTFIRLGHFKRAIIDCDFVINKLDEKNLNAWLFRAKGYHGLGNSSSSSSEYDKCVSEARKNHPKRLAYINEVVRLISQSTEPIPSSLLTETPITTTTTDRMLTE